MKLLTTAVAVALLQILIVCSLGAKLLYDRRTRPQAWFKAERYDPDLPIRGRYVSLQVEVNDPRSTEEIQRKFANEIATNENLTAQYRSRRFYDFGRECGSIELREGSPIVVFDPTSKDFSCVNLPFMHRRTGGETVLRLNDPIIFFIPDTAKDPTRLSNGEELWVLATIPRKGPPRPIALGIKQAGGASITPLTLN